MHVFGCTHRGTTEHVVVGIPCKKMPLAVFGDNSFAEHSAQIDTLCKKNRQWQFLGSLPRVRRPHRYLIPTIFKKNRQWRFWGSFHVSYDSVALIPMPRQHQLSRLLLKTANGGFSGACHTFDSTFWPCELHYSHTCCILAD